MKITFLSNFYNPHVSCFCESLATASNIEFSFIECEDPQKVSGSAITNKGMFVFSNPPFVFSAWKNENDRQKCIDVIEASDVLILGSCDFSLLPKRIGNRLLFIFSERPFKKTNLLFFRKAKYWLKMHRIDQATTGCLCASAYAKGDFSSARLFQGRCLKWGYFPKGNLDLDLSEKEIGKNGFLNVYWSGRMIDWKRPEISLIVAKKMEELRIPFHLNIAGDGPLKERLIQRCIDLKLQNQVSFSGFVSNDDNLQAMALSDVVLLTSNREEGWGASVNEAMSSKCVVIASRQAGSVPFLIEDGVNGYSFEEMPELFDKIKRLVDEKVNNEMAKSARETIEEHWNGTVAAKNLLKQIDSLRFHHKFDSSISQLEPGSLLD
jgi:glycosyltransferase involved in cell wall biosynthesis